MSSSKTSSHTEVGETSKKLKSPFEESSVGDLGGDISLLPIDIALDIFARLPIKDLKRCMRVKSSWYKTLHSRYFTKIHHEKSAFRSSRSISFIVHDLSADDPQIHHDLYLVDFEISGDFVTSYCIIPLTTRFKYMNVDYEIVGCSKGLICFFEPSISDPIYLCNPVLGEYMTLPPTTEHPDMDIISGFGFDASTGTCKVVRLLCLTINDIDDDDIWYDLEAEVYTVGSKGWKKLGVVPYPPRGDKPGLFLNGALHWMCDRRQCQEEPFGIVSFNLATEKFSLIQPPHGYGSDEIDSEIEDGQLFDIKILKGEICYLDQREDRVMAWAMKEYGVRQSWTQELSGYDLFHDFHVLNFTEGLPPYYEAFAFVPTLVSLRNDEEGSGRKGKFKFEQWSKRLCAIPSLGCPHIIYPADFHHQKAAPQVLPPPEPPKDSQVMGLIEYDEEYEYNEPLALEDGESSDMGSTSIAEHTSSVPRNQLLLTYYPDAKVDEETNDENESP